MSLAGCARKLTNYQLAGSSPSGHKLYSSEVIEPTPGLERYLHASADRGGAEMRIRETTRALRTHAHGRARDWVHFICQSLLDRVRDQAILTTSKVVMIQQIPLGIHPLILILYCSIATSEVVNNFR